MLNQIISFSVSNKLIIGLFVLGLIGYGAYETTKLPIDAVPDITDNQVQVITVVPSLGAPDVERLITFPIEQVNSNIPGLKKIRSFSRFGLSVVTIVFEDHVDVYWARQQVTERLQQAQEQIPKQFGTPALAPVTTGLGEIYQYSLRPKPGYEQQYTAQELRTIQDWIVRRQLLGVKGVADVASFGGFLKQYEIAADPARLKAHNITMNELFTALENNNQNTGGAYIEKGPALLFIRSEGLVGSVSDIGNIVIKNTATGAPLLVRDVADIHMGHATRYGAMTYNGEEEVTGAVVMMLKGANSSEVVRNIKTRIAEIQQTLPEGVMIDPFLDRSKMVSHAIGTVTRNLMEGALIVIFVLILFLGNLRAGLLVASVIPLSLLFAIIMMNIFGVSGNLMSLGALDFGLIIDGAVIIVEAVMHTVQLRREELSPAQMDATVNEVSARMRNAAIFGEIIIFIVYIPIFTLQGIEGKMFLPMAQTVAFALLGAFILSLTYVPMMSALVLSRRPGTQHFSQRMMAWLEQHYQRGLERVLRHPGAVITAALCFLAVAVLLASRLGGEFIPVLPEGDFAIETRVLPGSNISTSTRAVSAASRILLEQFPEVEKVVGKTGSSEIPTDPMPVDASDIIVSLKPKREWTSASTYDELMEKMGKELEAVPGVSFGFQYPVAMRFNELMTGARQDVVCKIYGEDLDSLARFARQLGELSSTIEGAADVYVETVTGMPQVVIRYDRAAIAQYGLQISDINRTVSTAFAGQSAGLVYEGEKRFDLVVRLSGEQRKDVQDIRDLLIAAPGGSQIPLNAVADVRVTEGPVQIQREDAQRRIIVGFNVRGRDVQSTVGELRQKAGERMKLPAGYRITYGGAFENLEQAKDRLSIAVPVSLLLIFLMLYFTFRSARQGLLIYSAIPLSAIGGIFALVLRGMPFSISAGVGFIALFGVAVLNGIVLVAEFNRLRSEGLTDPREVIVQGTRTRLRPVLMTALVASLGFLPMAISTGEGAEVQRPLATVVIGGLLFATLLTLFVLPVLYIMFEGKSKTGKAGPAAAVLLCLFLSPALSSAQVPLTLRSALDTALQNNLLLQNEKLRTEYLQQLKGTAYNLPQMNAAFEYGQINSAYNDNRFTLQQATRFPSVYARQRTLYNEQWKSGMLSVAVQENELKKQVTEAYFELAYLREKQRLLQRTDSLFAAFLRNAELRFSKGESNVLEKTTAEAQRGQIGMQLAALQHDVAIWQLRFQMLLNTATPLTTDDSTLKMRVEVIPDTAALHENPVLRQLQQQQQTALARWKLERSKLMPDLFATYSNMTIRGTGADNRQYSASDRFQSFQVGVGIPVFFRSNGSEISATKLGYRLSQQNYQIGLQAMQSGYQQAVLRYRKHLQNVAYYESTALKNAATMSGTADAQFRSGAINYLEWVLLTHQAITIESEYLDTVRELNSSAIEIHYYTNR